MAVEFDGNKTLPASGCKNQAIAALVFGSAQSGVSRDYDFFGRLVGAGFDTLHADTYGTLQATIRQ